jgi:hypothetical protein
MNTSLIRLTSVLLLTVGAVTNIHAESASSTAASAGSASVGSLSDSLAGSSASSTRKVAAGDYDVIEVAAMPERAGMLRLQLKPRDKNAGADTITLTLPARALGERGITTGETIHVRQRVYGFEFARAAVATTATAQTREEVFFLALDDAWHRELDPRPVTL